MIWVIAFSIIASASTSLAASRSVNNVGGLACDFETDFCGYTFDLSNDFDWTRSNDTPSYYTGPSQDHTTGTGQGHFVYLETSWPRLNGEKARLESPVIHNFAGHNCLEFYYHMHGSHINTLHVYMSTDLNNPIWTLKKEQGDAWKKAQVPVASTSRNFQVIFEGIVGPSYRGDIAIDDINSLYNPSCSLVPVTADPLLHKSKPPTPAPPLPDQLFCGFKRSSRIVNGTQTNPGDWPWQAMLLTQKANGYWKQFCGGTLIYLNWVLTAAHCVVDTLPGEKLRVRMGAYYTNTTQTNGNEQDFDIVQVIYHPDYNSKTSYDNDLALVRLDRPAKRSASVNYACLPKSGDQFLPGKLCTLTGWGDLESGGEDPEKLMAVEVPIVSHQDCTAKNSYPKSEITSKMLCGGYVTGGKDTCQGDSGGPLSCRDDSSFQWHIVGVTSWGYGCALPDYYGIYARVGSLLDWLARALASA